MSLSDITKTAGLSLALLRLTMPSPETNELAWHEATINPLPAIATSLPLQSQRLINEGPALAPLLTQSLAKNYPGHKGRFMVTGYIHPTLTPYLMDKNGSAYKTGAGRAFIDMPKFLSEQKSGFILLFSMDGCHARDEHLANFSKLQHTMVENPLSEDIPVIATLNSGPSAVTLAKSNKITMIVDVDGKLRTLGASCSGHVVVGLPNGKRAEPVSGENMEAPSADQRGKTISYIGFNAGAKAIQTMGILIANGFDGSHIQWPETEAAKKLKTGFTAVAKKATIAYACTIPGASEGVKQQGWITDF